MDNYEVLISTWEECLQEKQLESDVKSHIIGVKFQMETFNFYFGMKVAGLILKMTNNLSATLQHSFMSASAGQEVAVGTVHTLEKMRSNHDWQLFWKCVCKEEKRLRLPEPRTPRKKRKPICYEVGNAEPEFAKTPEKYFHQIWNQSFDLAKEGIKERFDQPDYGVLKNLEGLIANEANGNPYDEELAVVERTYPDDFDSSLLELQLKYVQAQLSECPKNETFSWKSVLDMIGKLTNA